MTDQGPELDLEGVKPDRLPDEPPPEEQAPAPAEPEAKAETEESAPPEEEKPSEEKAGDDAAAKPPKRGADKRIAELTAKYRSEERRVEQLLEQNERLLGMLEKPEEAKPETVPRQEDFEQYDDYLVAKAKHEVRKEVRSDIEALKREQETAQQATRAQVELDRFNARADEARARHEDYDEVVANSTAGVTEVMTQAIRASDLGPDIVYHLGQNPETANRITTLAPIDQVRELGKLEALLVQPKKQTTAPPPPTTVTPTGAAEKTLETMSFAEYEAFRKKQEEKSR